MQRFDIRRARIPTCLFLKKIRGTSMESLDLERTRKLGRGFLPQSVGPSASRTLSFHCSTSYKLFNRTIVLFKLTIRNTLESMIPGRLTGRIEYHFLVFGGLSLLVIEIKYIVEMLRSV
jgi:hypothetical protein